MKRLKIEAVDAVQSIDRYVRQTPKPNFHPKTSHFSFLTNTKSTLQALAKTYFCSSLQDKMKAKNDEKFL